MQRPAAILQDFYIFTYTENKIKLKEFLCIYLLFRTFQYIHITNTFSTQIFSTFFSSIEQKKTHLKKKEFEFEYFLL